MPWRLLTDKEIEKEFPRQAMPIVAVVAELADDGTLYSDTCFVLYKDGMVVTPNTETPYDELRSILKMLDDFTRLCAFDAPRQEPSPA